jgi:hypothetical protein
MKGEGSEHTLGRFVMQESAAVSIGAAISWQRVIAFRNSKRALSLILDQQKQRQTEKFFTQQVRSWSTLLEKSQCQQVVWGW